MTTAPGDLAIWPTYETFCIQSLLFNCRAALASIDRVGQLLEEIRNESEGLSVQAFTCDELLHNLQNIVIHGAALSRYFWPARSRHEARGAFLRKALAVGESSPLKNRELRNQIEHFDEKLDIYLAEGVVGYIIPSYVGEMSDRHIPTHVFRAYYVDEGDFEMLGKRYAIEPLAHEIIRLHDRLALCAARGGRLMEKEI